jgi:hypothetical protein
MLLMAGSVLARQGPGITGELVPGPGLVVIALLLIVATSAIRLMLLASKQGKTPLARLAWASPTIAYLLIAAAISVPGIQGIGWGAPWAVIVATEFAWWLAWFSRGPGQVVAGTASRARQDNLPVREPVHEEIVHDEPTVDDVEAELNELLPPGTTRRASRSHVEEEGERLDVLMRLTFPEGQRSQFAHLPIQPPFPSVPVVSCHQIAGPGCSITIAESQSFGVRLELRLSQMPTEQVTIVLQAEMVEATDSSAAA